MIKNNIIIVLSSVVFISVQEREKKNNSMCRSVLLFFLGACILAVSTVQSADEGELIPSVEFEPNNITLHMHQTKSVNVTFLNFDKFPLPANASIAIVRDNEIVHVQHPKIQLVNGTWTGSFNVTGIFLGAAKIRAGLHDVALPVVVIREERFIDKLFTVSVAVLVSILYINFGAALDLSKVKMILVRPVGPAIGFFCQYLVLPLVMSME